MQDQLIAYLNTLPHIHNVGPISVVIKGTEYKGAIYDDKDNRNIMYLLGERPASYVRSSRTCFVINGEDWYITCYMEQKRITAQYAVYHPCGASFQLRRWSVPDGGAIDRYEMRPYTRVPTKVI